jgi:DNA-directed RNA polymerase specialized sigma24 family protein
VARYAAYGDQGALRYLRRTHPFGKWARRVEENTTIAEDADAPEDFVEELAEALARLAPAERAALRRALNRSE